MLSAISTGTVKLCAGRIVRYSQWEVDDLLSTDSDLNSEPFCVPLVSYAASVKPRLLAV